MEKLKRQLILSLQKDPGGPNPAEATSSRVEEEMKNLFTPNGVIEVPKFYTKVRKYLCKCSEYEKLLLHSMPFFSINIFDTGILFSINL